MTAPVVDRPEAETEVNRIAHACCARCEAAFCGTEIEGLPAEPPFQLCVVCKEFVDRLVFTCQSCGSVHRRG